MDTLIELLILLVEVLLPSLFEVVLELGGEEFARDWGEEKERSYGKACFGWFVIGSLCGGLSGLILPWRLFPWREPTGLSVVLSPLLCGALMSVVGDWRRKRGHRPISLASFWGGAIFAFGFALVRFWTTRLT